MNRKSRVTYVSVVAPPHPICGTNVRSCIVLDHQEAIIYQDCCEGHCTNHEPGEVC